MKNYSSSYPPIIASVNRNLYLEPDPQGDGQGGQITEDSDEGGGDQGGGDDSGGGDQIDLNNIFDEGGGGSTVKPSANQSKTQSGIPGKIKLKAKGQQNDGQTTGDNQAGGDDGGAEEVASDQGGEQAGEENNQNDRQEGDSGNDNKPRRDYAGFSKDEAAALRSIPNKAFAFLAPHIRGLNQKIAQAKAAQDQVVELTKQLEGKGIPQNWYDHPQAYRLTPEYSNVDKEFKRAAQEEGVLRQALGLVKAKQGFKVINSWDDKGNPVFSEEYEPDEQAEAIILGMLSEAQAKKIQWGQEGRRLSETFKQQHQAVAANFVSDVDKHLNNLRPEFKPTEDQIKVMVDALPKAWQGHPLAKEMGKLFGVIINQAKVIKTYMDKKNIAAAVNNDKRQAGPSSKVSKPASGGSSSSSNNSKNVIDFAKLEEEYAEN